MAKSTVAGTLRRVHRSPDRTPRTAPHRLLDDEISANELHQSAAAMRLFGDLRRQAKRMPSGIEQHPPALWIRLGRCKHRAEADRFALCFVQVVHRKIKVYLLGHIVAWPRGCLVIRHPHSRKPPMIRLDCNKVIALKGDLSSKEL